VRERLIEFIRREYPAGLPRLRAALESNGDASIAGKAVTGTVTGHRSPITDRVTAPGRRD
jgi:hypothetical protein